MDRLCRHDGSFHRVHGDSHAAEKTNRQRLAYVGLTLLIISNALSIQNQALMPLLMSRLVAGWCGHLLFNLHGEFGRQSQNGLGVQFIALCFGQYERLYFLHLPDYRCTVGYQWIFGFYLLEALPILLSSP